MVLEPRTFRVIQGEASVRQHLTVRPVVASGDAFEMLDPPGDVFAYRGVGGPEGSGRDRRVRWHVIYWETLCAVVLPLLAAVIFHVESGRTPYSVERSWILWPFRWFFCERLRWLPVMCALHEALPSTSTKISRTDAVTLETKLICW